MVLGAVLAVFSVNLKRTLACSSMSQIGFIIIAIGMQGLLGEHNALAASGTLLHFLNHSLFKLLLFLGAGVIFMNLRELNLNKIRGYGKDKPLLKLIFLMPILGIGGIPLWNGLYLQNADSREHGGIYRGAEGSRAVHRVYEGRGNSVPVLRWADTGLYDEDFRMYLP